MNVIIIPCGSYDVAIMPCVANPDCVVVAILAEDPSLEPLHFHLNFSALMGALNLVHEKK